MAPLFNLKGRTALVTGSGQGMGLGITQALARQGADVFINDIFEDRVSDAVEAGTKSGLKLHRAPADVTDKSEREAMLDKIASSHGGVDILVNNAGVPVGMPNSMKPFHDMSEEDYDRQLSLNFKAVIALIKAVLPHMLEQGHGRILNITSESWRLGQGMGLSDYASAKAAGVGLMRTIAAEYGRKGITINALSLGAMNNFGYDEIAAKITAVGRAGTPDDVGAAAAYLVSDEASWMTGQTIALNGGSCTA